MSIAVRSDAGLLKHARLEFEREYVAAVLRNHGGNATQAARTLGISRQMLQRKIKEYGLRAQE
jgi:arginine utilization regulatory protein